MIRRVLPAALLLALGCSGPVLVRPGEDIHKRRTAVVARAVLGPYMPDARKYRKTFLARIAGALRALPGRRELVADPEAVWDALESGDGTARPKSPAETAELGRSLGVEQILFIDVYDFRGEIAAPVRRREKAGTRMSVRKKYSVQINAVLVDAASGTRMWDVWVRESRRAVDVRRKGRRPSKDPAGELVRLFSRDRGLERPRERCMDRSAGRLASAFGALEAYADPEGEASVTVAVVSGSLPAPDARVRIRGITESSKGKLLRAAPKSLLMGADGTAYTVLPEGYYRFEAQLGERAAGVAALVESGANHIRIALPAGP